MLRQVSLPVLAAVLVAACATSPTGRKQLMLVSESQAINASRQAYVQEMGKLADDSAGRQRQGTAAVPEHAPERRAASAAPWGARAEDDALLSGVGNAAVAPGAHRVRVSEVPE
jgi:hypothetical protein